MSTVTQERTPQWGLFVTPMRTCDLCGMPCPSNNLKRHREACQRRAEGAAAYPNGRPKPAAAIVGDHYWGCGRMCTTPRGLGTHQRHCNGEPPTAQGAAAAPGESTRLLLAGRALVERLLAARWETSAIARRTRLTVERIRALRTGARDATDGEVGALQELWDGLDEDLGRARRRA
mgnify:CR=1 FL=1